MEILGFLRHARREIQQVRVLAIRVHVGGEDAGLLGSLQHHGAGTVAEQHAGVAVGPIHHARQGLGAHHQRALGCAGLA